jgi:phosphatidylinositol alpha-1,6-mannosyltransferase
MPLQLPSWGVGSPQQVCRYQDLIRGVGRLATRCGCDIVHANRCLPEGLIALALRRLRGLPYVLTVHGEELNTMSTSRELRVLGRLVLRGAARVIANSQHTRSLLADWRIRAERIDVVTPGVDLQRFVPADPREIENHRAALHWHDRCVILTAGRLQQRKGHDMLLRALPRLIASTPSVLYAIAGGGALHEPLVKLAHDLGVADHVQFQGELGQAELCRAYQACDVFALPNRTVAGDFEGFGMVLLEAQASGRAVLAGDSGGTAEAMRDGVTGVVADCTAPEPLAAALRPLLRDASRRAAMGDAGRQWVAERFDWDLLSAQLRRSLEDVRPTATRIRLAA